MKRGGGRAKGNSFERKVAKMIVDTFKSQGITSDQCYRTPSSGGHRYAKREDPGDLVIGPKLQKLFGFAVEAKHYKKIDLFRLFDSVGKHPQFKKWIPQACAAVNGSRKIVPMLVFRQNHSKIFCALPAIYPLCAHLRNEPRMKMEYYGKSWSGVWYIYKFETVLKELKKEARR